MDYVDLHTHSTASDGSFRPQELVTMARDRGLRAMALTDHDTIDGVAEAIQAGAQLGIEVIPGIEISADFPEGTMHILGYFIDYQQPLFNQQLQVLKEARAHRNPRIVEKLNQLGLTISWEDILQVSGGGQIGRPHIARALVVKGYVQDQQEAFDQYLRQGGPAYVPKFRLPPAEAIALIRQAQGIPVLAHPFTLGLGLEQLKAQLQELQELGLAGLEVYYPEHSPNMQADYFRLTQELGLLVTGGSDFHGANKPGIELGKGPHQRYLTYELVLNLKAWLQTQPRGRLAAKRD
ncbi:MAG: PHP domain-containing protein [Deltaproteobacteria bacterium]|nr:PHP domain-containing protein [Deltaproteobacteria bacterium]MBW1953610.1 PHP domain-containing protein [Deltaproteobacteria bacterium]MBW1987623.1 PHP domain-containing protein [Deltaproteobacteria bacterium]